MPPAQSSPPPSTALHGFREASERAIVSGRMQRLSDPVMRPLRDQQAQLCSSMSHVSIVLVARLAPVSSHQSWPRSHSRIVVAFTRK